jgi:hypothetical protein
MSGAVAEARERLRQAMILGGFHTAAKAMAMGETYVANFRLCETQWVEWFKSGGDRFYDHIDNQWMIAKKTLTPKSI